MLKLRLSFVVLASCALAVWSTPPTHGQERPVAGHDAAAVAENSPASGEDACGEDEPSSAGGEETAPSRLPGENSIEVPPRRPADPFGLRAPLAALGRQFGDSVLGGYESRHRCDQGGICIVVRAPRKTDLLNDGISRYHTWDPFAPPEVENKIKGFAGFTIECGISK